jgi:hypothetical protein
MKKYLLLLLAASSFTQAATFNVSTTAELRVALSTAATNGEDDTIVLADGTYKTTNDGGGAFTYLSNEIHTLKMTGSSPENVILSGDNTGQIFFNSHTDEIKGGVLTIENMSFINANFYESGGAIFSNQDNMIIRNLTLTDNVTTGSFGGAIFAQSANIEIYDSNFERNYSSNGGGAVAVYNGNAIISGSNFIQNTTGSSYSSNNGGGAIQGRQGSTFTISNSTFTENTSSGPGGAIMGQVYANELRILNNTGGSGGGIYGSGTIKNSIIKGNMCTGACYGGGIHFGGGNVFNNIIEGNSSEIVVDHEDRDSGALYAGNDTFIINNLFKDNSSGASAFTGTFINNIFINNGAFDIKAADNSIATIKNNYIDVTKIQGVSIKSDNIFNNVNLGFIDELISDYRLKFDSDLIDAGAIDVDGITLPELDFEGVNRVSGGAIDIGPYEFSTTRPTINTVTYSGVPKEQNELTFITDYTLTDGREVTEVLYDFLNDGNNTTLNTHTYTTAGSYTVNVKVTDSEGEFSTSSSGVTISELPWIEMTYEQKLIKAILPEYYDLLISEIEFEKSEYFSTGMQYVQDNLSEFSLVTEAAQASAVATATTTGIVTGKQYVQDNLSEFSLVTEAAQASAVATATTTGIVTGKQYVQDNLSEFSLVTEAAQASAVATATSTGITDGENNVKNNPVDYGLNIVVGLSKDGIAQLPSGWKMISIPEDVADLSIFDDAKIVWFFNNEDQAWTGYSSNNNVVQQMKDKNIGIITSLSTGDGVFIEM